ncbi:MAG: response regulator [Candidatus Scalindua sediminis]|nr:response regulator [Candidatus Scalindua sediminis]
MDFARILIVADVRETVDNLRDFFESNGYEAEVALNNKVASAILEERKMDLAIVGFKVQDISGIEILKNLRTIDPRIPVVLIHGTDSKRTKALIKKAGAQGYIPNPIEGNSLINTVKRILTSRSSKSGRLRLPLR